MAAGCQHKAIDGSATVGEVPLFPTKNTRLDSFLDKDFTDLPLPSYFEGGAVLVVFTIAVGPDKVL